MAVLRNEKEEKRKNINVLRSYIKYSILPHSTLQYRLEDNSILIRTRRNLDFKPLLTQLTGIGPRYAEKEIKAAKIIEDYLASHTISFTTQPFKSEVPVITKAELTVDGEKIECIGSSVVSGEIPDGEYLVSHFGYSGKTPYNIAYSPMTDSISVVDHYKVPSVSISRKDVVKIVMAKEVRGKVEVERRMIDTKNILVGNLDNPKNIVFAHFDSIIGQGAVDNAGSIITMMGCLVDNPELLKTTLFNFSGTEEMAYDDYKLSGYGFRVFESQYANLLEQAQKVLVLDGLGVGKPSFSQNGLDWVLQLKMLDKIRRKVFWLQNDQTPVLQYFHTFDDKIEILGDDHLKSAQEILTQELGKGR